MNCITPAALRRGSVFEVAITARYLSGLQNLPDNDLRRAGHQRTTLIALDPETLTITHRSGLPIETQGVVVRRKAGLNDVLDLTVDPDFFGPDRNQVSDFRVLDSLSCEVTLDVYGDGGSLLVPSDRSGAGRRVRCRIARDGDLADEEIKSIKAHV